MDVDVGGYRRIRLLSPDPEDQVYLARRVDQGDSTPVVIRLASGERAEAELEAIGTLSSPHVVALEDLFSLPDGRIGLVFPRLPGGSLADLLARRESLLPGEAVTLLISVARGLTALHESGRSHGTLRPARVLFDRSGTPVLTGFASSASLTAAGREADERDLARLAVAVLSRTSGTEQVLAEVSAGAPVISPAELERIAFRFAEPEPLTLDQGVDREQARKAERESMPRGATRPLHSPLPAGVPQRLPAAAAAAAAARRQRHGRRAATHTSSAKSARSLARGFVERARTAAASVRRRTWLLAGGSVLALLLALVLIPAGPQGAAPRADALPATPSVPAPELTPLDTAPLQADDPLDAALALSARRDECFSAVSADCLGEVDQPGSALLAADRAALAGGAGPGMQTLPQDDATPFVQRVGDTALVTVDAVSLLLLRLDGQWRRRAGFGAVAPAG